METAAAMSKLNWVSLNGMGPIDEVDFMSQLLGNYPFITDQGCDPSFGVPPTLWPGNEDTTDMVGLDDDSYFYCFDAAKSSLHCWPQWNSTSHCITTSDYDNYAIGAANVVPVVNESSMSFDLFKMDEQNICPSIPAGPDKLFEDIICLNEEMGSEDLRESGGEPLEVVLLPTQTAQHKRKMRVPESETAAVDEVDNNANPSENSKKCRVSRNVQRNGKNMQEKKNLKTVRTAEEDESSMALNGQSSSSYSSEDDSNTSREINGDGSNSRSKGSTALNSNGKTRAGRGAATDPQSLYARKRRERINERLRILQNLVPNGTKVDISTMLEEAVQYVKFLQLQIKLLSSDDLWMYAPIAYNGMDIGIDLKISL